MWCEAGYAPDAFWHQTPRLIEHALRGYRDRRYAQMELAGWQALVTVGLGRRSKKDRLPALKDIIPPKEGSAEPKLPPPEEVDANMRAWAAVLRRDREASSCA